MSQPFPPIFDVQRGNTISHEFAVAMMPFVRSGELAIYNACPGVEILKPDFLETSPVAPLPSCHAVMYLAPLGVADTRVELVHRIDTLEQRCKQLLHEISELKQNPSDWPNPSL